MPRVPVIPSGFTEEMKEEVKAGQLGLREELSRGGSNFSSRIQMEARLRDFLFSHAAQLLPCAATILEAYFEAPKLLDDR